MRPEIVKTYRTVTVAGWEKIGPTAPLPSRLGSRPSATVPAAIFSQPFCRVGRCAIVSLLSLVFSSALSAQDAPSFAKDVAPIFNSSCAGCHGANVRMGSLSLDTYDAVEKGGTHGKVIEPGKSSESRLYLMITGKLAPKMPLSGSALAEGDIEIVRKWIDAGAKPPTAEQAKELAARLATPEIPDIKAKVAVKPQIGALAYRPDGKLLALGTYK